MFINKLALGLFVLFFCMMVDAATTKKTSTKKTSTKKTTTKKVTTTKKTTKKTTTTKKSTLTSCKNVDTTFSKGLGGWYEENKQKDTWKITSQGLQMIIKPPKNTKTLYDYKTSNGLPYNAEVGNGATFNATNYMHYGSFSAVVKSSSVGGTVTAVILMANNGDEIDFELLGGKSQDVTTNFFWGKKIVYGVNGKVHTVPKKPISEQFYNYTVNWTPDKIDWFIDSKKVRTTTRTSTCQKGDDPKVCRFPSAPARVQIGFWDGSGSSGTAEWAHGPINWKKIKTPVSSYIKRMQIRCNPKYNKIVK